MVFFGVALVLLILFMPTGLAGVWRSSRAAWGGRPGHRP
jgi:ABC-type branched-subunit amino acid transport system permease subunit